MPPEQARGDIEKIDERSDVYSLGAVLYTLLSGEYPYTGKSHAEIIKKVLEERPRPLADFVSDGPRELIAICDRAMAANPDDRYQTARELATEVQRFQAGALVNAYAYSVSDYLKRFVRRYRPILTTAAAAFCIVIAIAVAYQIQLLRSRDRERDMRLLTEQAMSARQASWQDAISAKKLVERENYFASLALAKEHLDNARLVPAQAALAAAPPHFRNFEWHYLESLCHLETATIAESAGPIRSLSIDPQGDLIVWGSDDGISLYDIAAARKRQTTYPRPVAAMIYGPATTIVLPRDAGIAEVIDTASGQVAQTFELPPGSGTPTAASTDGRRFAFARGNSAEIWDAIDGTRVLTLAEHHNDVTCLAFSKNGDKLISGSRDNTAIVWSASNGEILERLSGHTDDVTACALSPDGTLAATGGRDRTVLVWDIVSGAPPVRCGIRGSVTALDFSNDGKLLAVGTDSNRVALWNIANQSLLREFPVGDGAVSDVVFGTGAVGLITAGADGAIRQWNVDVDPRFRILSPSSQVDGTLHFALSADGRVLAAGGATDTVTVWNVNADNLIATIATGPISRLSLDAAGAHLLALLPDGTLSIWDIAAKKSIFTRENLSSSVIAFSAAGNRVAFGEDSGAVTLFDVEYPDRPRKYLVGNSIPSVLAFHVDGKTIAAGTVDGHVAAFDIDTSRTIFERDLDGAVTALAFSRTDPILAAAARDLAVWNWRENKTHATMDNGEGHIAALAFSPDGSRLVSGADNGGVSLWDPLSGRQLLTLPGNAGPVSMLGITADKNTVIAAGQATAGAEDLVVWRTPGAVRASAPGSKTDTPIFDGFERAVAESITSYAENHHDEEIAADYQLSPERFLNFFEAVDALLKQCRDADSAFITPASSKGALILDLPAANLLDFVGIKSGDLLQRVNQREIVGYDDAIENLDRVRREDAGQVELRLHRGGTPLRLTVVRKSTAE